MSTAAVDIVEEDVVGSVRVLAASARKGEAASAQLRMVCKGLGELLADNDSTAAYLRCLYCNEPYGYPTASTDGIMQMASQIVAACGCVGVGTDCVDGTIPTDVVTTFRCAACCTPRPSKCYACRQADGQQYAKCLMCNADYGQCGRLDPSYYEQTVAACKCSGVGASCETNKFPSHTGAHFRYAGCGLAGSGQKCYKCRHTKTAPQ